MLNAKANKLKKARAQRPHKPNSYSPQPRTFSQTPIDLNIDRPQNFSANAVEAVIDHKVKASGQILFKVRWKRFSKHDTWEPAEHLRHAQHQLAMYKRSRPNLHTQQHLRHAQHQLALGIQKDLRSQSRPKWESIHKKRKSTTERTAAPKKTRVLSQPVVLDRPKTKPKREPPLKRLKIPIQVFNGI